MSDLDALKIDRSKSTRPRRRRGGSWGWLVALALLVGAAWLFRGPLMSKLDALRLPKVTTVRVTRSSSLASTAVSGTAANGYIVARTRAALSADTPGRIVELNVKEGSVVKAGDVVARLYSLEYEADVRRAEADVASSRVAIESARAQRDVSEAEIARLESLVQAAQSAEQEAAARVDLAAKQLVRAERLVETSVQSQQLLDEAQAEDQRARAARASAASNVEAAQRAVAGARSSLAAADVLVREAEARVPVAEAVLDGARATLAKTEVKAPFDGIVVLKDAEVGEVVSPNSLGGNSRGSVITMVDFASLEVQVEVPETSLAAVAIDAPVMIYLDAFPQTPYTGRVDRIWPTANRQKATVEVRARFEAPDEQLRPEMGVRVVFTDAAAPTKLEADEPSILISTDHVVRVDGADGVFMLERDVVHWRPVRLGAERSGRVVVESGLESGDQIVASPPVSLSDGDRVQLEP